ncbi:leucine-rich repeat and coiled-coil domain-containing protein 1 [Marchantia polymorpha subsp. ruderalis]|uniref:Uncharacterized protein n=2 Tax=Marchantia polymorpha TaxID=3197 RepID=A0AAF6BUB4_MARPO|nr:hypothetical protein MARPO_0091s0064 [Marchantia polymorpha]BBN15598.1 hypothetical protein Mp_6g20910 [Marchantia polymorpha subsp. ruderalis]|eukprot:PTQ33219.1 hypothetical protein MARPO_0091s0064 [Marchantia polymorpha]
MAVGAFVTVLEADKLNSLLRQSLDSTRLMESADKEQESKEYSKSSADTPGIHDNEIKEIHFLGAGLKSLRDVAGLSSFRNLQYLSLHDNNIDRIECLETLDSLRELNLSSNTIKEMEGLSTLSQLQVLNLSCNQIEEIRDLQGLRALKTLVLSHNHVKSLSGLSALNGPRYSLRVLDLRDNRVESLSELTVLAGCLYLKELVFSRGNHTNPNSSHGKSLPGYEDGESRYLPPYIQFSESQQEKALFTSRSQVSIRSKQPHVENTREDDSQRRPCHPNPAHIDVSAGEYCTKSQPTRHTSCQQNSTRNLPPESKSAGLQQAQEASPVQSDYMHASNRADQPSSDTLLRHPPNLSEFDVRGLNEDSDQDFFEAEGDLEIGKLSSITRPVLPAAEHSKNGFYRRRWPRANSIIPLARRKNLDVPKVCDGDPLEVLEQRILHLVHKLALAKKDAKWRLQAPRAESPEACDDENFKFHKSKLCDGTTCRSTRTGKEVCSPCPDKGEESNSSDTSDTRDLRAESTSRQGVCRCNEKSGRSESRSSIRRWMILVKNWITRMNLTKSDIESVSEGQGSELEKVLRLLNKEVKHLHEAVASFNSGPKSEESPKQSEENAEAMSKSRHDEVDTKDSELVSEKSSREDQLAEARSIFLEEKRDMKKLLDTKEKALHDLENQIKVKNEKVQELLRQAKQNFTNQRGDPALCPEDDILQIIISLKKELSSMEKSLQNTAGAEKSAKVALLNAIADKEKSKHLVISMYKALEEERANLKLCKSELDTCQQYCLKTTKEQETIKSELEKMLEEKEKELTLSKELHKQEIESIRAISMEIGKNQGLSMAEECSAQLRHSMREQLLDKQNELHEAQKENVKVRQDMESLQKEHQKAVAELNNVIQNLLLKEQNNNASILELSAVVQSQKAQIQAVNFDVEKLTAAEKELQRRKDELSCLRQKAFRCDELVEEVENLQQKLTEVSQDANDKSKSERELLSQLMSLKHDNNELASAVKKLELAEDAVKIKNVMLESQNESIRDLKQQLLEAREAFNRVLKTSETLESECFKRLQDEAEKGEDLRRELSRQALVVDNLEEKLRVERLTKVAAERTAKFLQLKVEEKEELLRYVEDEISQVKNLYDNKVREIAVERDQAMEELKNTRKEIEQTKEELLEEAKRRQDLSVEAEKSRELLEARNSLQNQVEALKAKVSEKDFQLSETARRVLELENELDCQSLAMEKQRAVASSKVEQLRRVLEDIGDLK